MALCMRYNRWELYHSSGIRLAMSRPDADRLARRFACSSESGMACNLLSDVSCHFRPLTTKGGPQDANSKHLPVKCTPLVVRHIKYAKLPRLPRLGDINAGTKAMLYASEHSHSI